jgi:hypothetical protein
MNNNLFWAIAYPIIALVFMIMGFVRDPTYFVGAIIIGIIAYYWIWKAWKGKDFSKKNVSLNNSEENNKRKNSRTTTGVDVVRE